jgi:hypothetical protein
MERHEVALELTKWLKQRRDDQGTLSRGTEWHVIDQLLDEVSDAAVEGKLPWEV